MRWRASLLALVLASAAPSVARAADTDEQQAMALFEKGRRLARDGRCADAIAPLLESVRHAEGVGALLNLGHCYEQLGKFGSAYRAFVRARDVAATRDDRRHDEAAQRASAIEKDVPRLTVRIPSGLRAGAEVRVDGETWPAKTWDAPQPIDVGTHEIELTSPPARRQTDHIVVRAHGERVEWTATEPPPARSPPASAPTEARLPTVDSPSTGSSQKTLGYVIGGLGIVGAAVGAAFGVLSISNHSAAVARCPTYPECNVADRRTLDDLNDKARTTGTVSTLAIVAGLVLVAGGAVLLLSAK